MFLICWLPSWVYDSNLFIRLKNLYNNKYKNFQQAQLHFHLICSTLLTLKLFFKDYQFQIFISFHNFSTEILEAISLLDYWAIVNNQKMDKLFPQMDQSTIILDLDPLQKLSQFQFILSLILHLLLLLALFLKNMYRYVWFFTKRYYNITHRTRHKKLLVT
ncbi:unnamed protein product [Paramecium primaurelia]|uniref:Transmembrane protein n=1 Tax=Paramecium primaurelia TaxID=5886 RepID=A0A8S1PJD3_PARPR|nr:unnamed protein product [Paramecium primaurelia]